MRQSLCVTVLLLGLSNPVFAQCQRSFRLPLGEAAPCSGILVPELTLNKIRVILQGTEADLTYCRAQRQADGQECEARLSLKQGKLDICHEENTALREITLEAADADLPEVPWYESVPFVVTITAVISIGVAVGFYALADHLAQQQSP